MPLYRLPIKGQCYMLWHDSLGPNDSHQAEDCVGGSRHRIRSTCDIVESYFARFARESTRRPQTGPPRNVLGSSVVFYVATCESGVAKTGRRSVISGQNWPVSARSGDPLPWKSSQPSQYAKHCCRRRLHKCHAKLTPLFGRGVTGDSGGADAPL